jgi:hypothetical protein
VCLKPVCVPARIAAKFLLVYVPCKQHSTVLPGTNWQPKSDANIDARVVVPGVVDQSLLHRLFIRYILLVALRRAEFRERARRVYYVQTTTLFTFWDRHATLQAEQNTVTERDAPFGVQHVVDWPGTLFDPFEFPRCTSLHFVPVTWIAPATIIVGTALLLAAAIRAVAAGSSSGWLVDRLEADEAGIVTIGFTAHTTIIRTYILYVKQDAELLKVSRG